MPPKGKSGLSRSRDDYAAFRCLCGHLIYASQRPGDPCLFCNCTSHITPAEREASA